MTQRTNRTTLKIKTSQELQEQNFEYTAQQQEDLEYAIQQPEESIVKEYEHIQYSTQHNDTELNNNNTNEQYNSDIDDVSIEDDSPEDTYVTINHMDTVQTMDAGQLNVDPKSGEENMGNVTTPTHMYNLRPRPTRRKEKYNMRQIGQELTIACDANPNEHKGRH